MLETPHAIIGAAIAYKVGNPALALPLALGSHFILEKIPHWNPHLNSEKKKFGCITPSSYRIVVLDASLALISGTAIAWLAYPDINKVAIILTAAFLAVLPDLLEAPYFFLNKNNVFIQKWIKFQKSLQADAEIVPGLLTQLLIIIATVWWILN